MRHVIYFRKTNNANFSSGNSVSKGLVLRGLDPSNGPARIVQSSYGFLRKEPYQPDISSVQREARGYMFRCERDGEQYIESVFWFMIKVSCDIFSCNYETNVKQGQACEV